MKPHSLFRLAQRIYNTPQLITPTAFHVILDAFQNRHDRTTLDYLDDIKDGINGKSPLDDASVGLDDDSSNSDPKNPIDDDEDTITMGLLRVDGSLTYKPVMTLCGEMGTSYQGLVTQVQEMADAGIKTIVMEVTSGGGEGAHCFQSAQQIRDICNQNDIQLIGYADEMACSAAYAFICISDVVVANPSAILGSIGVVVALLDQSVAYEQAGLKRIFITSGDNKVPFAADGTFKQSFLDEIQEDCDKMNAEFIAFVSANTGLSEKSIKDYQAQVFDAETAVQKGLANAVMTHTQFAAYVAQAHQGKQ